MRIFALGDPHLSFGRPKPMEVFGELWKDHPAKLAASWDAQVEPDDVVLVVGDISWAHSLKEALPDLQYLADRPGRLKLLLRGNHDSWWSSPAKVRAALPGGLAILNNDALRLDEGVVLCGARGWNLPELPWSDPEKDPPIYHRELERLDRSLTAALTLRQPGDGLIALLHFPPVGPEGRTSSVLQRLATAQVGLAAYGHLHGEDHAWAPEGRYEGVELRFVAVDHTLFAPRLIWQSGRGLI